MFFQMKILINYLMKKYFCKIISEGLFCYKDYLYKHIDGVAMGSRLRPTLTNFFLAQMETKILHFCVC